MSKPMGLIALMGLTGSGKSSLTNGVLGRMEAAVGDGLESLTVEPSQHSLSHKSGTVCIVDTPGFNDNRAAGAKSDFEVLKMIEDFLKDQYGVKQKFSGIILMHNINASQMDWHAQQQTMDLFKELCGSDSMKNTVVVTSFWDQLSSISDGIQMELELQSEGGLLKELYDGGAKFVRYGHFEPGRYPDDLAFLSPDQIIDYLLNLNPDSVETQKEMAGGTSIAHTTADASLAEFEKHKHEAEEALGKMRLDLELIKRRHEEELKQEGMRVQEQLEGLEKYHDDMRTKFSQWEKHQDQVAMKDQLEALVPRIQNELGSLHDEVLKLRQANNNLHRIDPEQIAGLNHVLSGVRKDFDDLAEECKRLWHHNKRSYGVGIGLNVNSTPNRATSLRSQPKGTFQRTVPGSRIGMFAPLANETRAHAVNGATPSTSPHSLLPAKPCLCVVCNKKPIHPPYATCGLKCAAELQELESRKKKMKSKSRMCPVCQMRPCAIGSTGTQYPTCGYTCSSKLPLSKVNQNVSVLRF